MTAAAVCMMVIGLALSWGGAALCIYVAMGQHLKKGKRPTCDEERTAPPLSS
jgi:hypothetical protein